MSDATIADARCPCAYRANRKHSMKYAACSEDCAASLQTMPVTPWLRIANGSVLSMFCLAKCRASPWDIGITRSESASSARFTSTDDDST